MVSAQVADGHMETMETYKDQISQPDKVRYQEIESLGIRQHKKWLPAHRQQSDIE
jgi:hypothetical protein